MKDQVVRKEEMDLGEFVFNINLTPENSTYINPRIILCIVIVYNMKFTLHFGKHKNEQLTPELYKSDPFYFEWLHRQLLDTYTENYLDDDLYSETIEQMEKMRGTPEEMIWGISNMIMMNQKAWKAKQSCIENAEKAKNPKKQDD
jgi:hypothetical protein